MPTDAEVEDEISFRYQMTPLDDVRAALDRGDGVKIVILDACRNNPIVNALRRKKKAGDNRSIDAVRGGLAKIDKAQGMVVAYSTAADEVAADGDGRNSPFTSAFLKRLKEPGLEIEQLFRRVAADVNAQTGGRQRPETYVSLLSNYYLNQTDRIAFDKIKDSPDPAPLQDFVAKFPTSSYVRGGAKPDPAHRGCDSRAPAPGGPAAGSGAAGRGAAQGRARSGAAQDGRAGRGAAQAGDAARAGRGRKSPQRTRGRPGPEEARLKLVAEKERKEREAAKAQEEQRVKLAAERERKQREDAQLALAEQAAHQIAASPQEPQSVARRHLHRYQDAAADRAGRRPSDPCDRDGAMLAHLRSNPSLEGIAQFEASLTCEKLRAQVMRLRESLSSVANAAPGVAAQAKLRSPRHCAPPPVVVAPPPPPPAAHQNRKPRRNRRPSRRRLPLRPWRRHPYASRTKPGLQKSAPIRRSPIWPRWSVTSAASGCARRSCGCARACPRRTVEGRRLSQDAPKPDQPAAATNPPALQSAQSAPAEVKPAQLRGPIVQVRSCDEERATLAKLRASQSREDVVDSSANSPANNCGRRSSG